MGRGLSRNWNTWSDFSPAVLFWTGTDSLLILILEHKFFFTLGYSQSNWLYHSCLKLAIIPALLIKLVLSCCCVLGRRKLEKQGSLLRYYSNRQSDFLVGRNEKSAQKGLPPFSYYLILMSAVFPAYFPFLILSSVFYLSWINVVKIRPMYISWKRQWWHYVGSFHPTFNNQNDPVKRWWFDIEKKLFSMCRESEMIF